MNQIRQHSASESGAGLIVISIVNQNPRLKCNWWKHDWLRMAPERRDALFLPSSWDRLFKVLCMSIKQVTEGENCYAIDASNAGKIALLLTGIADTHPEPCRQIMTAT